MRSRLAAIIDMADHSGPAYRSYFEMSLMAVDDVRMLLAIAVLQATMPETPTSLEFRNLG